MTWMDKDQHGGSGGEVNRLGIVDGWWVAWWLEGRQQITRQQKTRN